ncbi:hypothetical protein ACYPKM_00625 [Pseudomonas aeruginosa]
MKDLSRRYDLIIYDNANSVLKPKYFIKGLWPWVMQRVLFVLRVVRLIACLTLLMCISFVALRYLDFTFYYGNLEPVRFVDIDSLDKYFERAAPLINTAIAAFCIYFVGLAFHVLVKALAISICRVGRDKVLFEE